MALRPDRNKTDADKRAQAQAAQGDALMREVDDAVRQDQYANFGKRYGIPLIAAIVIGLVAFGGYLFWQHRQSVDREHNSEQMTLALDQLQAGNLDTAAKNLDPLVTEEGAGPASVGRMLQAGIAAEQNDPAKAAKLFDQIADNADAPQAMRDLATIRSVAVQFDTLQPGTVIARLKPLAVPGNAFFGSAGEMLAMAYLQQGNRAEAGKLFARISKDKEVPDSLRSRSRQMAGVLGVDAIEDVDEAIAQSGVMAPGGPGGPGAAAPQQ
ncbi:tetratricopeptide repeat protein [Erythrobacter sp. LQ02-29]|uniref:tetratricopeptide repeat protein n=1 Tax=Erythrobacter sp. LQ02-29 TaxID=2920384 RepID=UPI001F4DCE2F|nr:tetratricopeptide repeat protein [Erythrobacter sp. LQ02-29]